MEEHKIFITWNYLSLIYFQHFYFCSSWKTFFYTFFKKSIFFFFLWAWQNQQNDMCAQQRLRSAQSDQNFRCALNMLNGWLRTQHFFMLTAKTLTSLGGFPGYSESSLGAQVILLFCHALNQIVCLTQNHLLKNMSHVMKKPVIRYRS